MLGLQVTIEEVTWVNLPKERMQNHRIPISVEQKLRNIVTIGPTRMFMRLLTKNFMQKKIITKQRITTPQFK